MLHSAEAVGRGAPFYAWGLSASASWARTMRACLRNCLASSLAGVADPDRKQASLCRHHARMPGAVVGRGTSRPRGRCGVDRGADPSASRHRTRLHRARRARAGREADRFDGRRGRRHHRGGAPRRRHLDDRPCRAFQSGRAGNRAKRSATRTSSRSRSPGSGRFRRACRMSAWSSTSRSTTST